uniref:ABC transporter domain-containing protein n=1 Tax=Laticauda laticaudata TaxID=8630 RepID=A0A8C5S1M8_LATLA
QLPALDNIFASRSLRKLHNILRDSSHPAYNLCELLPSVNQYIYSKNLQSNRLILFYSGAMKPGLNAILGPTGCGKSSLLDILSTRKDPQGLSGDILLDGMGLPTHFKCMSGYVVQVSLLLRGIIHIFYFPAACNIEPLFISQSLCSVPGSLGYLLPSSDKQG